MEPKFKIGNIVNAKTLGDTPLMVIAVHTKQSGVHRYDLQTHAGVTYGNIGEYEISSYEPNQRR